MQKKLYHLTLFTVLLFFSLTIASCDKKQTTTSKKEAKIFTFTAIPDQDTSALEARFGKIATYLTKELGLTVKYIPVKDYAATVNAFKYNHIQLAWFGGLSGVKARLSVKDSTAIAQGFEDPEFVTYIIAHSSTGLTPSDDFPSHIGGKKYNFTFGSKGSTSGRLMPEFFLRKNFNQSPDETFKRVGFSGSHSKTVEAVASGSYQIGAVNFKVFDRMVAEGKADPSKVSVIWKTPFYPDYNWSIRGDVDATYGEGFTEKVQSALVNLKDEDLLKSFPRKSFIKADNSMYQPILDTAQSLGLIEK